MQQIRSCALIVVFSLGIANCRSTHSQSSSPVSAANDTVASDPSTPISAINSPLVTQFITLVSDISNRNNDLDSERDRRGQLLLELGLGGSSSCASSAAIQQLQIEMNGLDAKSLEVTTQPSGNINIGDTTDYYTITIGNPNTNNWLVWQFDNNQTKYLGMDTTKLLIPSSPMQVSDLQQIKIVKRSPCYDVQNFGQQVVVEVDREELDLVRLTVNGQLLYDRESIDHVFGANADPTDAAEGYTTGLTWTDSAIQLNDAYVSYIQAAQCQ